MPTPNRGPRMGGSPAHERHMLANLANQLFTHGRITTTEAKAKRLRPYAEHLITFAKRGDLHARRQVIKRLGTRSQMETGGDTVMHVLFDQIGPRYATRPGGYTRIVKLGPRKGDNAPMAIIELVEALTVSQRAVGEAERARGTTFAARTAPTGATRESAEELAAESPTAAGVVAEAQAAESAAENAPAAEDVNTPDVAPDEVASDVADPVETAQPAAEETAQPAADETAQPAADEPAQPAADEPAAEAPKGDAKPE